MKTELELQQIAELDPTMDVLADTKVGEQELARMDAANKEMESKIAAEQAKIDQLCAEKEQKEAMEAKKSDQNSEFNIK